METCILSLSRVFKCNKSHKELLNAGNERILNIIESSKHRQDCLHFELEKQLHEDSSLTVKYHKDCVSTYTSPLHIERYLKRICSDASTSQPSVKRSRRSEVSAFNFREHCLFCGNKCNIQPDPKHPKRWRKALICRTACRPGTKPFKETILDVCKLRNDEWAKKVQTHVMGAVSDLHAADARYHDDCRLSFMGSRNTKYASKGIGTNEIDEAFHEIFNKVRLDTTKLWTSVELHDLYCKFGGQLNRPCLMKKLCDILCDDVYVFSSPGLASFIIFKSNAPLVLRVDEVEDSNVQYEAIVKQITDECKKVKTHKNHYDVRINKDLALEESSPTMLHLLECISEKMSYTLPSLLICNIVTSMVRDSPTSLQIALGVETRERSKIDTLHDFGVTCTYDEVKRFKSSIAKAAINGTNVSTNSNLRPITEENTGLIQAVADNFDANICSQNGLKSTHALALLMTQDNSSAFQNNESPIHETIERVSKNDMQIPTIGQEIQNYQGPKKPNMPIRDGKRSVLPLKVLAKMIVVKTQASNIDMQFMKDIASKDKIPEYGGYNTAICRSLGKGLKPATKVMYTPLIDMVPSDPDTMMTAMYRAQRLSRDFGQSFTVFTADQQLYRVMINVLWVHPRLFPNFYPRLGGMHTLMSFVGCVGSLMCNSGLEDILKAAFGGVAKMLCGKNFPQNVRALRMVAEEILRNDLQEADSYDELLSRLQNKATQSRTSKLWLECLIKPVMIMMLFIRAEREGEWVLHLTAVASMMPYFFAAGHINYARYGLYYLRSMENLPENVQAHFSAGEHVMRHQTGIWNGLWSDMFIESTFMRYGHGPGGLIGITLKEESVKRWALSLHTCSRLLQDIKRMRDANATTIVTKHKEEGNARISADSEDRAQIRQKLEISIHPLQSDEHPEGIVNVVSGKISSNLVNVDNAVTIGKTQMELFECSWPEGFNTTITNKVITMKINKKNVKFGETSIIYDTQLIYSRVIGLLSSRSVDLNDIMSHELAPVPTSMFDDNGDMRVATSKSILKKKLQITKPTRFAEKPDTIVVDGCAILWCIHWPKTGTIQSYLDGFWSYISLLLRTSNVYLVFDRYFQFSIKGSTRMGRADPQSISYKLSTETPLPKQSTVFTNTDNKVQLIDLLCEDLKQKALTHTDSNKSLMITGSSDVPLEIQMGVSISRHDLKTSHEEADVIITQQAVYAATHGAKCVKVICDDTDVFVLLIHFYSLTKLSSVMLMEGTSGERTIVDIGATVAKHQPIMPSLLAAHALTGCDTVARLSGIGKVKVTKLLDKGTELRHLGELDCTLDEVVSEATTFIAGCYGKGGNNMSDVRYEVWKSKVGRKAMRKMPKLQTLPPTTESFRENVKRAHFQACVWKSSLDPDPPDLDVELFGWRKDLSLKVLVPVTVPDNTTPAPACVMKLISCSCSSETPCVTNRCGCNNANLACTLFCKCNETGNCENRCTKEAMDDDSNESGSDTDN